MGGGCEVGSGSAVGAGGLGKIASLDAETRQVASCLPLYGTSTSTKE